MDVRVEDVGAYLGVVRHEDAPGLRLAWRQRRPRLQGSGLAALRAEPLVAPRLRRLHLTVQALEPLVLQRAVADPVVVLVAGPPLEELQRLVVADMRLPDRHRVVVRETEPDAVRDHAAVDLYPLVRLAPEERLRPQVVALLRTRDTAGRDTPVAELDGLALHPADAGDHQGRECDCPSFHHLNS